MSLFKPWLSKMVILIKHFFTKKNKQACLSAIKNLATLSCIYRHLSAYKTQYFAPLFSNIHQVQRYGYILGCVNRTILDFSLFQSILNIAKLAEISNLGVIFCLVLQIHKIKAALEYAIVKLTPTSTY